MKILGNCYKATDDTGEPIIFKRIQRAFLLIFSLLDFFIDFYGKVRDENGDRLVAKALPVAFNFFFLIYCLDCK